MLVSKGAFLGLLAAGRDALEQTTTANVGAFSVPLGRGQPLRRTFPSNVAPKRKKKRLPAPYGGIVSYDDLDRRAQEALARLRG